MPIKRPAFIRTTLETSGPVKERIITVKLNAEELQLLQDGMNRMQQEKESTALKMLAKIGYEVLRDQKTALVLATVLGNLRRNERLGIAAVEANLTQK